MCNMDWQYSVTYQFPPHCTLLNNMINQISNKINVNKAIPFVMASGLSVKHVYTDHQPLSRTQLIF